MIRGTHVIAVLLMAIGSVLGFAAAMGKVDLDPCARADQPAAATTADSPRASVSRQTASCDGANKGAILALAAHNQTVAADSPEVRQEAEHLHHLGRRHRPVEHQRLLARA